MTTSLFWLNCFGKCFVVLHAWIQQAIDETPCAGTSTASTIGSIACEIDTTECERVCEWVLLLDHEDCRLSELLKARILGKHKRHAIFPAHLSWDPALWPGMTYLTTTRLTISNCVCQQCTQTHIPSCGVSGPHHWRQDTNTVGGRAHSG